MVYDLPPAPLTDGGPSHRQPSQAIAGHKADAQDGLWTRDVTPMPAQGVQPTVGRWEVRRAAHSSRSVAPPRLEDHPPQDVTTSLETLGSSGGMTAWHSRQAVEAIPQVVLSAAGAWAQPFAWSSWQASARPWPATPPTMAREGTPTPPTAHTAATQTQSARPVRRRDTQGAGRQAGSAAMRRRGSSRRTAQAYGPWGNRLLTFGDPAAPRDGGVPAGLACLHHLAVTRQGAATTHNQARHACACLSQQVLQQPLDNRDELVRATRPQRLPVG
jgi:hypothetical protein